MRTQFPNVVGKSEVKRICSLVQVEGQRYGQAVCNRFDLPKDLEDKIWESDNPSFVWQAVYENCFKKDYQNDPSA